MPATICVVALLVCLIFVLLLAYLLKKTKVDGPVPKTFREAFETFRAAKRWRDRLFVIFLCTPIFFGESYKLLLAVLAVMAFIAVIAICGSPTAIPLLQTVRDILRDTYKVFSGG